MIHPSDIPAHIEQVGKIGCIERAILFNDGTVQTLLSALCGREVKVEVVNQFETGGNLLRTVYLKDGDSILCTAMSVFPVSLNNAKIIDDVLAGKKGIGQIIDGRPTTRIFKTFTCNEAEMIRSYVIRGIGTERIEFVITEVFDREAIYEAIEDAFQMEFIVDDSVYPTDLDRLEDMLECVSSKKPTKFFRLIQIDDPIPDLEELAKNCSVAAEKYESEKDSGKHDNTKGTGISL